jgi:hypothetical protein
VKTQNWIAVSVYVLGIATGALFAAIKKLRLDNDADNALLDS